MTLSEMREQRAGLLARAQAVSDLANGRDLNDDEQALVTNATNEAQALTVKIENLERQAPAPRVSPPKPNPVTATRDRSEDDPKGGFPTVGHFIQSVIRSNSGPADNRLARFRERGVHSAAGSDEQSGTSNPYGGFLVPEAFSTAMLSRAAESDPILGRTTVIPMEVPRLAIPARTDTNHNTSVSGGLRVYRRSETQAASSSRMEMEQVLIEAHPLMGLTYVTEELLRHSPISVASLIESGFQDEFTANHIRECLDGTGVGEAEGINNNPAAISVAKESGQAAASIVYDNILNMRSRCWNYGRAIWLYNHDCLPHLAKLQLPVGTGGQAMWHESAKDDVPSTLMGRPAFATEFCKTLGTVGDLILCDWSQYVEGVLGGVESTESIHVRFVENERAFRLTMNRGGKGWWRSALQPKQSGSPTLSPFVRLATRA